MTTEIEEDLIARARPVNKPFLNLAKNVGSGSVGIDQQSHVAIAKPQVGGDELAHRLRVVDWANQGRDASVSIDADQQGLAPGVLRHRRHHIGPICRPQVYDLDAAIACVVTGQAGQRKVLPQANLDEPMRRYAFRNQVALDGACPPQRERTVVFPTAHTVRMALDCETEGAEGVERKSFGELRDLFPRTRG